jgi:hypothetical protein
LSVADKILYGKFELNEKILDINIPYSPSKRFSDFSDDKLTDMYSYAFQVNLNETCTNAVLLCDVKALKVEIILYIF